MSNLEFARAQARDTKIKLHGADAFAGMQKAGQLVAEALDLLVDQVRPGVTTEALEQFVFDFAMDAWRHPRAAQLSRLPEIDLHLAEPRGLPRHPRRPRALKEGDILNIDVTLIVDGWHGDSSRMYAVGKISRAAERLLEVTYNSLMKGVAAVGPGATTGDIGARHPGLCRGASAAASCAISVATAWARCSMTGPTSCITASPAKACRSSQACCSPSSR